MSDEVPTPQPESSRASLVDAEALEGGNQAYGQMVWQELRKKRIAMLGLRAIVALVLLAVYAPLIASNQPFFYASEGQAIQFPLFGSLFNRLLFENTVDIFFNLILAMSPVYVGVYLAARRLLSKERFYLARPKLLMRLVGLHLVLLVAMSPETVAGVANPLHHKAAVTDFKQLSRTAGEQGRSVRLLFPPLAYGYRDTAPVESVNPPSAKHWLGTDAEGRDVFTRMLFGIRISLTIGLVAVSIYVSIGVFLGALAGYFGGWVDLVVSRLIEVMICFPSFFLILSIAALIEQRSIFHVMVIIGATSWTGVARLIRAEFLKQRSLEYSQAAIALGLSHARIMLRHILPNAIAPVLVSATFGIASAILVESSLAFLGVGDLSVPSWGETLNAGRTQQKIWLVLAPGAAIFFVVSVFNLVGEGLRDALDPKLKS